MYGKYLNMASLFAEDYLAVGSFGLIAYKLMVISIAALLY